MSKPHSEPMRIISPDEMEKIAKGLLRKGKMPSFQKFSSQLDSIPKMGSLKKAMSASEYLELQKAKYKRRWRWRDGKWRYDYRDASSPREAQQQGGQVRSLRGVSASEAQKILREFKRRAPGNGIEKTIQTAKALEVILTRSTFCMVSAGLSPDEIKTKGLSKDDVKARHNSLIADLTKKGYVFTSCRGKYGAIEESVMVMTHDADLPDMLKLGSKYKQDSVLFVKQGKSTMIKTTGKTKGSIIMAGVGHDYDPDAKDYYTKVPLGNGANVKFAMRVMEKAIRTFKRLILGRY